MTVGYIIFVIILGIIGVFFTIAAFYCYDAKAGTITLLITIIVIGLLIGGGLWYYGNTANGIRAMKDQESNLNNGIKREIIITAEDGREIYYYCGKCDIETNDNYIIFEDEEGHRQMIYWGVTDTIIIHEID